jgi:hypothetical protein
MHSLHTLFRPYIGCCKVPSRIPLGTVSCCVCVCVCVCVLVVLTPRIHRTDYEMVFGDYETVCGDYRYEMVW